MECLTPAEFSFRTGMSIKTVRRLLKARKLPYSQPAGPGGLIRIPQTALDAIVRDGQVRPLLTAPDGQVNPADVTLPTEADPIPTARLPGRQPWFGARRV
jgi:excisionase family DNA binding protein